MAIVNHFLHEHPRVRTRGKHPSSRVCGRTCVLQRPVYIYCMLGCNLASRQIDALMSSAWALLDPAKALRLAIGLYKLSPNSHDKPMKLDCGHPPGSRQGRGGEELQEYGNFAESVHDDLTEQALQQVQSKLQERRSARSLQNWEVWGRGSCVGVLEADGAKTQWDLVG